MQQILGDGLAPAFQSLEMDAVQKYKGKDYEVWELTDDSYSRLCSLTDKDWLYEWGWWRWARCIFEGCTLYHYLVNGMTMLGYLDEDKLERLNQDEEPDEQLDASFFTDQKYSSFTNWLSETFSLSSEKHIACFAISLADANNLTLAEFMKRYQP